MNLSHSHEKYADIVNEHRDHMMQRFALRALYKHWANRIRILLSGEPGLAVELGCGCGILSEHFPEFQHTDVDNHEWIDKVVNACDMPYAESECSNIIAVDVLHHLPDLTQFFDNIDRCLKKKGRLILLEPYISLASYPIYKFIHFEPLDLGADPFSTFNYQNLPPHLACNEALPTSVFGRCKATLLQKWPTLKIPTIEYSDGLIYLLTGGFSKPQIIPASWIPPFVKIEDSILKLFGKLLAMRMLVVIEKT